jgi:hypothetical protein
MNKAEVEIMQGKIMKGVELAYERLLIEKQKDDSELVFSHNGKIVAIKARELVIKKKDASDSK